MFWLPTIENKGLAFFFAVYSLIFFLELILLSCLFSFHMCMSLIQPKLLSITCIISQDILVQQVFWRFNLYEKVSFRIISPVIIWMGYPMYMYNYHPGISFPNHPEDSITLLCLFHLSIHFIYSHLLTVWVIC